MADDSAALIVAMEAKLDKFVKGMDTAYSAADRAAKQIESRFSNLNGAITKQFDSLTYTATSQLGGLGTIMRALGPAGTAAAVGIGVAALAFHTASDMADKLATKARGLKDFAASTGLTTTELQALNSEAGKVGITSEENAEFIQKFTTNLAELREGSGTLFTELRKIGPEFIEQLATAKTTAEAITVLSRAYNGLSIAEQNRLSKAAGGRSGIAETRLLAPGIDVRALTDAFTAAGKGLQENLIDRLADLKLQSDKALSAAKQNIAAIFSEDVLENELKFNLKLKEISELAREFKWSESFSSFMELVKNNKLLYALSFLNPAIQLVVTPTAPVGPAPDKPDDSAARLKELTDKQTALNQQIQQFQNLADAPGTAFLGYKQRAEDLRKELEKVTSEINAIRAASADVQKDRTPTAGSGNQGTNEAGRTDRTGDPSPGDTTAAQRRLALLRPTISALGDAAKFSEQYELRTAELNAALETHVLTQAQYNRALTAAKVAQSQAVIAIRERLGVASQEEIVQASLTQLEQQRTKGLKLTADEAVIAEQIIRKEAQETFEQLKVRASALPGLTRLGLDAANLNKNLDTLSVDSLNNLTTAISDVVTGTNTASAAFKNLGLQVIRSLSDMLIKMTIVAPIARALQSTLTGGGGGLLSIFGIAGGASSLATAGSGVGAAAASIGRNATGTDNWRGGPTWVGERGPEIVNLPRGSQVIPNDVARQGGGATAITYAPNITISGASTVTQEQLAQVLANENSKFQSRTVAAIQDARRRSVRI